MSFLWILLLVGLVIFIPIWYKKRKKEKSSEYISERKNKDEVWKTIKQFLKDHDEYGKEIVESYVIKRNHEDYINPNWNKIEKTNKKAEVKIREFEKKQLREKLKKEGKNYKFVVPTRDLYVVCFSTRSKKSSAIEAPRAIECEVINKKINKKDWDRKIVINKVLDYDEEMEWIAPAKFAEEQKTLKAEEKMRRESIKKEAIRKKRISKEKSKKAKKEA